jgi:hypothetical protein
MPRPARRLASAAVALGLQGLFALLLLWAMAPGAHQKLTREMTLLLRPALRAAPQTVIDAVKRRLNRRPPRLCRTHRPFRHNRNSDLSTCRD